MTSSSETPSRVPCHEAFWPHDLRSDGVGWVIVARFKSGGRRVEAGIFLVDVLCLGVKLAVYEETEAADYQSRIRDHYAREFAVEAVAPACARKLVEEAVAYAERLGFAPHPDFRKAARVFGGVSAADCPQTFTFGSEGKPFYRRGPRETEAQARRIIEHLQRRCGEGGFNYLLPLG